MRSLLCITVILLMVPMSDLAIKFLLLSHRALCLCRLADRPAHATERSWNIMRRSSPHGSP